MTKLQNTIKEAHEPLLKRVVRSQIFIPFAALALLVIFNLIMDPTFFSVTLMQNNDGNPVLTGNLITILNNASELVILAIGMTLVTAASGGQDISVGATIAVAGSVMLRLLCGADAKADTMETSLILAFVVGCLASMLCGAFNGTLVAYFKIQPMVATLIMYTAGRSIAAWINGNKLPVLNDPTFAVFGGFIPGVPIPTPVFVAVGCMIIIALVMKFTTLKLYTQSVGINSYSSRLNGLNPAFVKFLTYVILGLCVGVAALLKVSRSAINYSTIAKDIEMDAILAVALGGNALSGGKFSMAGSILGAYVIQFLTTTLYNFKVPSDALPAYKAVVVIILVVISAPVFRDKMSKMWKAVKGGK